MNWEQITGGWKQMINRVKGTSTEFTDEELAIIAQKRDQLIAFLQESYGCDKEQAAQELDNFTRRIQVTRSNDGNAAVSACHDMQRSHASQAQ